MIHRDTAEPLIKGLWRMISSGKLPDAKRQPLSHIKSLLETLQAPIDDKHERRILDVLVVQIRHYDGVPLTTSTAERTTLGAKT